MTILSTNDPEAVLAVVLAAPRGETVDIPMPDEPKRYVWRLRGRLFSKGIRLRTERTDGRLRLWAFDLPPRYTPTTEDTP